MVGLLRSGRNVARAERKPHSPRLVIVALAACGIVAAVQQSLLLPLLPELPRLLHTSADNTSWLVTATLLTGAVSTPVVTRLADMHGKRSMIVGCLLVMTCGSVLGALSHSLATVLVARALQGVGVAIVPVGIAAMRDELPRERIPLGVALMSATLAIGASAGPTVAAVIIRSSDWHAVFWLGAVLGLLVLGPVLVGLSRSTQRAGGSFDFAGALLLSGALTAVLLVISKGGSWGWTSLPSVATATAGLTFFALWIPLELRVRDPLVDLRTATRPTVLPVNIAGVLLGFAMFTNPLVTTQLLQLPTESGYGLGFGLVRAGLWLAPMALMFGVMAPIAAAVTRRFDARVTLLAGAVEICLAYVARNLISPSLAQIVCGSVLVAAGTSMAYAALPTLIMSAVPVTQTASANGLNTLGRAIGQSTASATLAAVLTLGLHVIGGRLLPSYAALQTMLWLAAAVAAGAALVTLPLFRLSRGVPPAGIAVVAVIDGVGDTATAFTALPDDVPDGPADRPRATQLSPPPRG